ncbi:MAG: class I SAM-dependent methyltransferase [Gammaproteobacteria bacterium]|nr:MAG: class I SAM-dependent methyltransferase [Gammaproteobacteria bacterium]
MPKKKQQPALAEQADRHELYELSVQCAEAEVDFVSDTFKTLRGRPARLLREDFCGTANVCCEWVRRHERNRAIGVDLDAEVLSWGRTHNLAALDEEQAGRISLVQADVLEVETEAPDIISAMNFSYWLFKTRPQLKRYFQAAHRSLKEDGILFLDAYGGYDSFREIEEEREIETNLGDVTYVWEQASFNPINHDLTCHIHFHFEDGSSLAPAFSYHWRLWTLPEIRDLLEECGFKVTIYWQGWDEEGEPDGDFYPATEADADAGWIAYITAEKQ